MLTAARRAMLTVVVPFGLSLLFVHATGQSNGADKPPNEIKVSLRATALAVDVSRDGTMIACAGTDGGVQVLRASDGGESFRFDDRSGLIRVIRFSSDAQWIVIGGELNSYRYPEPQQRFTPDLVSPGFQFASEEDRREVGLLVHRSPVTEAPSSSSSKTGFVLIANTETRKIVGDRKNLEHPIHAATFSDDKRAVYAIDSYLNVHGFKRDGLEQDYRQLNDLAIRPSAFPMPQTSFSRNPMRFVSLAPESNMGTIRIKKYDFLHGDFRALSFSNAPPIAWAISISTDGRRFVTSGPGPDVLIWDFDKALPLKYLTTPENECLDTVYTAFNATGTVVLTYSLKGIIRLWDLEKGQVIFTARGAEKDIRNITIQEKSILVVSGGFRSMTSGAQPLLIQTFSVNPSTDTR